MANLLADPSLWAVTNQSGYNDPPAVNWTGSAYEDSWGEGNYYGLGMVVEDPIPADASVDGIITWTGQESVQLRIGSQPFGEVVLYSATLDPGVPQQFSVTGFEENARVFIRTDPDYSAGYTMAPGVEPIIADCEEYGRATRAFVSGYQRDRVHQSRLVRGEKRCLVANFNGAIPPGRTIASAIWRCDQPYAVAMAAGRIFENDRSTAVDITAQYGNRARIKCQVTLDNGEVYNQLFMVRVFTSPWFQGETQPAAGPYDLTVTA